MSRRAGTCAQMPNRPPTALFTNKVSQSIIEHRSRGKQRLTDTTEAAQFLFSILKSNRLSHWQ